MKKLKKNKEGFFRRIINEIMESVITEVICEVLFFVPRLMFRFIEHIF
ncbi:hypothetical protein J5Y03_14080 [Bacillus sp. RG28]|uniref:Uncharacterized protein n=1 Tax=Gottfriedia endophytica TaxID=2820819 RepID=A0A940NR67_9BACI|nr:hypothetical protein [Gottfriedia endophytica]MBP0726285.1 hypothetical protein [Gottfriedia endophytica]